MGVDGGLRLPGNTSKRPTRQRLGPRLRVYLEICRRRRFQGAFVFLNEAFISWDQFQRLPILPSTARTLRNWCNAPTPKSVDSTERSTAAQATAADTRRILLSNTLVIVVNVEGGATVNKLADLTKPAIRRIALAEPQTVPAGIYAKEYLQKNGLWKEIADKVIPTENVRACLGTVESGNADAGIVYRTDALISKQVKIAYAVTASDGPRISYPIGVVKGSENAEAARKFVIYLASPEAGAIFAKFGFRPAS